MFTSYQSIKQMVDFYQRRPKKIRHKNTDRSTYKLLNFDDTRAE